MKARFALALAAFCTIVGVAVAALYVTFRGTLDGETRAAFDGALGAAAGALVFVALLLCVAAGALLHALFRRYILEPRRIADEAQLIASANPAHRVMGAATPESQKTADAVNALASHIEALKHDVEARVAAASRELAEEKTRLAALISELTESVVACNSGARVLLYNDRAQRLLSGTRDGAAAHAVLGLGRSLFTIFDRNVIAHAIEELQQRHDRGEAQPVSVFLASLADDRIVRVKMAPVRGAERLGGFILVIDDVTREVESGMHRETRMGGLITRVRSALGNIGAAVDALSTEPRMDDAQRARFLGIVAEETRALGGEVERVSADEQGSGPTLSGVRGDDLLAALTGSIARRAGLTVSAREAAPDLWARVDRFMLSDALVHLAARLRQHGVREVLLALERRGHHARLEIEWRGAGVDADVARAWQRAPVRDSAVAGEQSFEALLKRQGAESWYARDEAAGTSRFCLLLPLTGETPVRTASPGEASRPTFYDFDLFHQKGQSAELDQCALPDLHYTVFDTETTGLAPSQGDEIVAIGAVRIVNGRVLAGEAFDQLVNPRRPLPPGAVRIHGITDEMVERAPPVDSALPAFHRYCHDSVLVAHNAAFDLRFLQLKESATGVSFDHPVLDTLMLSAVIHPHHADHTLEAIAGRLGVAVAGRHTALGDAMLTAEVFVRMIPLLRANGIVTLGQAREAASRTAYARVTY